MTERDLTAAPIRSRIEAWLLDIADEHLDRQIRDRKASTIGAMGGTVAEIGPGTGTNMRFYADGVSVIGFEPNPNMHSHLQEKAEANDVDLEIRTLHAEHLDLDDASVDAVVATLVLCSVDDPVAVLDEIVRILRPGGTFFFMDHVVAPDRSLTRRVQSVIKAPHRWMFQGCTVDRDTAELIRSAGFADVDIHDIDSGPTGFYVRHQIIGTAVR
jgi:ubiquinone/menaquinone biosynthesis C-methylase UbiE